MEPEAKYTVVGVAVLLLLALLAGAVVWLRSSGEGADARQYKIYFERQSLEGLEPRSYVTMRGMRVGSVTGFRFSAKRPTAVEVFISVEASTPVRQSTRATVERHLVTGLASVRLVNLTEESPPLVQNPPDEPHPVIAEGESPIQQVSATLTQLAQRVDETMQQLNAVLSPENRAAFSEVLQNLRRVAQHADGTLTRADDALGSLGAAADEVRALAGSVAGDARTLTARYDALGSEAAGSVREINAAVRKMSADLERLTRRADELLASGDQDMRATADALRSAADSVGAAASRLRDPRGAIFGPAEGGFGPGEGPR
jgi:phospholipid/cholesterol/gamma-HCH transport system substrate-binding protein